MLKSKTCGIDLGIEWQAEIRKASRRLLVKSGRLAGENLKDSEEIVILGQDKG